MARPQEAINKKEFEKRRARKRKEKEERKRERKENSKAGQSLEEMMAYVDENGNISSVPPDPTKKRLITLSDIVTGSNNEGSVVPDVKTGKVSYFNLAKGYGFITDSGNGGRIFVHMNALKMIIKENDIVSFETERGPKGLQARDVKILK